MTPPDEGSALRRFTFTSIEDATAWEALVPSHPHRSIFGSWAWGTYKQRTGWRVTRLRVDDERQHLFALATVHAKRRYGMTLFHLQGGPVAVQDDDDARFSSMLTQLLAHLRVGPLDVVVVSPYLFRQDVLLVSLISAGFCPVLTAQDYTLTLDLSSGVEALRAGLNRRWRRALRPASPPLTVRIATDDASRQAALEHFGPMYAGMAQRKGFESEISTEELIDAVVSERRFVVLEVLDGDEVVAIRIGHVVGDLMTDFLAATTPAATRTEAGYCALWSLVEHAIALGLRRFDCGGIDPFHNQGVFQFKRGLSRTLQQSEPIWLFSRTAIVRRAAQLYWAWS